MAMIVVLCPPGVVWRHGMNVHSSSNSSRVNEARAVNVVLSSDNSKLGLRKRCNYNNSNGMELLLERSSLIGDVFEAKADRSPFAVGSSVAMVSVEEQKFAVSSGQALPLGASLAERGINFALFSERGRSESGACEADKRSVGGDRKAWMNIEVSPAHTLPVRPPSWSRD